jgi:hypothetical protein
MDLLEGLLLLTGFYPLGRSLRANRRTTLWQPLLWASVAWAAWLIVAGSRLLSGPEQTGRLGPYLALCLTSCAGVAVLGARRPGNAAWNFIVVALLAVLLLPVLNGLGEPRLDPAHAVFLGLTLLVPVLNYLPTRLGLAALLLAAGCVSEFAFVLGLDWPQTARSLGVGLLAASPWVAWWSIRDRRTARTEFDRLWLAYRDRFGFVWGQRMREQFNRAAHHAGWPVVLRWSGLETPTDAAVDTAWLLATLRAVLKRFGPEEERQQPQEPGTS